MKQEKRKKITMAERREVYNKYRGRCAYCGEKIAEKDMQIDLLIPIYNGGTDDITNYMPSCRMCNFYKSTMSIEKFRDQLSCIPGRLSERTFIYKMAKKYNLVVETKKPVIFYYEKVKNKRRQMMKR